MGWQNRQAGSKGLRDPNHLLRDQLLARLVAQALVLEDYREGVAVRQRQTRRTALLDDGRLFGERLDQR